MSRAIGFGVALAAIVSAAPVSAQENAARDYDVPAQPLGSALLEVARLSGQSVVVGTDLVVGRRSPRLKGRFAPAEALDRILAGSGLRAERVGDNFVVTRDPAAGQGAFVEEDGPGEVLVTGSRIRGAPIASPVITRTAEDIRNEGQATLVDVIRTIPQNFGGGQNPGVGLNVPAASGSNVGEGASLNLRGIGSDATLTLLNGRRLSYSSSRQSVEISAIPVLAVERIEIVADGASAIYGSDAVAGVANIRLKRDAEGLLTSGRLGGSTDGGNFEQIYGALAGSRWSGGGAFVAYEFSRNTPIRGEDRSYARSATPGLDLFPSRERHSAVASGHQALSDALELSIDLLYGRRRNASVFALGAAGDRAVSRGETSSRAKSLAVAPALAWRPGAGWRIEASGSYGSDRVRYETTSYAAERLTSRTFGCYCNEALTAELAGDGPLFALPGGPARVALGVGYRDNRFVSERAAGDPQNVRASQESRYAYGELSLPLIGPAEGVPAVHRLTASAALRYEHYPSVDDVVTPKLGLNYAPSPDLDIKASWGRSFRAPTLLQRFQPLVVGLFAPSRFGGSGFAAGSTVLYVTGGRETLLPERAQTWSATVSLHPRGLEGATLELSYFDTRYRDRIVAPIAFILNALADPIYADQITRSPSGAQAAAVRAAAGQFLNSTGQAFDPARVVAIIDNASVNAGQQRIRGLDGQFSYTASLGGGALAVAVGASYLESEQQLTTDQPVLPLAGTLFNPPHLRVRATAGWTIGGLTLTAAATHAGGVDDPRMRPVDRVNGVTQADLTLRYRTGDGLAWWRGLDLVLTAQNLLNAKPDRIATTLPYDTPYDSTNYSPVGRFLAVAISKQW